MACCTRIASSWARTPTSITEALALDQFVVYYQPVIGLASGKPTLTFKLAAGKKKIHGAAPGHAATIEVF